MNSGKYSLAESILRRLAAEIRPQDCLGLLPRPILAAAHLPCQIDSEWRGPGLGNERKVSVPSSPMRLIAPPRSRYARGAAPEPRPRSREFRMHAAADALQRGANGKPDSHPAYTIGLSRAARKPLPSGTDSKDLRALGGKLVGLAKMKTDDENTALRTDTIQLNLT